MKLRPSTLLLASVLLACASGVAADSAPEGLVPIKVRYIDEAYMRPGAVLTGYSKVFFKPVTVSFSKNWDPRRYGTFGLKSEEIDEVRTSIAEVAHASFRDMLQSAGYILVDAPGQGVLELDVQVTDLYINAPAEQVVGARTYVMSAGEMRLVTELRTGGVLLYRTVDHKRGDETGRLEWATKAWNRAEARRLLDGWARQLKATLSAPQVS